MALDLSYPSQYGRELARSLGRALGRLRVLNSMHEDLSYPEGDPRRMMPTSELPPEIVAAFAELETDVVYYAALVAGETVADAKLFGETPHNPTNPYNLKRVQALDYFAFLTTKFPTRSRVSR